MIRQQDQGGVSGTGHVLDGIEFSNKKVAVAWLGKGTVHADFIAIHVDSHPANGTIILWEDDPDFPS